MDSLLYGPPYEEGSLRALLQHADTLESSDLLFPSVTEHSFLFSPVDLKAGALFNADVYRDSMLIDRLPGSDDAVFYQVAKPGNAFPFSQGSGANK